MPKHNHHKKSIHDAIWISGVFIAVILIWFAIISTISEEGQNPVNTTNSIFSALAFAGVIVAIYLQRNELILQREELESTRTEFVMQNQTLKKQRFENTFFNLLNVHHGIVEKIHFENCNGRDAIVFLLDHFKVHLTAALTNGNLKRLSIENFREHQSFVMTQFAYTYRLYEKHLAHYLKNLIFLAKYARSSELLVESERQIYYDVISSQLNPHEIILLFYYLHVGYGVYDKDLFNTLSLGRQLDSSLLADIKHSFLFDPDHIVELALINSTAKK